MPKLKKRFLKVAAKENIDNLSQIKDFITSYPEFRKKSGTVSRHVSLVSEISK